MNLYEYQGKELFARFGIPVLPGQVAATPEEARDIAARLGGLVVIKAQVMAGGRGIYEFEVIGRSGTRRWLETHAAPLPDANGQVTAMLGITRDITERKLAEESMRELSARLLRAQDEERRRIARELHDNTAQQLAALSMNLVSLQKAVAGKPTAEQTLTDTLALTELAAQEIRTMSYLLHPPVLEEVGLVGTLLSTARRTPSMSAGHGATRSGTSMASAVPRQREPASAPTSAWHGSRPRAPSSSSCSASRARPPAIWCGCRHGRCC